MGKVQYGLSPMAEGRFSARQVVKVAGARGVSERERKRRKGRGGVGGRTLC